MIIALIAVFFLFFLVYSTIHIKFTVIVIRKRKKYFFFSCIYYLIPIYNSKIYTVVVHSNTLTSLSMCITLFQFPFSSFFHMLIYTVVAVVTVLGTTLVVYNIIRHYIGIILHVQRLQQYY